MAEPVKVQDDFSLGMRRDDPRDNMAPGSLWDMKDYLLNFGAPLRKRGGWTYESEDFTAARAGASDTYTYHVGYIDPSASSASVMVVDSEGFVYRVNPSSGTSTSIGSPTGSEVIGQSFVHRDLWIGSVANAEGFRPRTWDGTTYTTTSSPVPFSRGGCVYKDYTVIVDGTTGGLTANRIYFSDPGDPTAWSNIDVSFFDFSDKVRALVPLRESLFVFTENFVSRLRGNIPPPGTDMALDDPFYPQGVHVQPNEWRAITRAVDEVIWANREGVFISDGAAIEDLTWLGGIRSYWQELIAQFTAGQAVIALGYQNGYLFVTLHSANPAPPTYLDTLCCDVSRRVWFRLANIRAFDYVGGGGELYFAVDNDQRVGGLVGIFDPDSNKNDANGIAVVPSIETPFYFANPPGKKSFKRVYVTHRTSDAASDNPLHTVSYIKNPHTTSYTNISRTIDEAAEMARVRRDLGFNSLGVAFKIVQSNASFETQIYDLEVEAHLRTTSRL
jgi:hypothetical protein